MSIRWLQFHQFLTERAAAPNIILGFHPFPQVTALVESATFPWRHRRGFGKMGIACPAGARGAYLSLVGSVGIIPQMDRETFRKHMRAELETLMQEMADAVYVHDARREVFAEDEAQGRAWADTMLHQLKHDCYSAAWETAVLCRATAGRSGRVAMDRLLGYMSERREMICYPEFLARGWQIGSGPIEAQCKMTTARVKGFGKRWDGPNAEAIMTLACLEHSRLWRNYWLNA